MHVLDYDLYVPDPANSRIENTRNMVSRNRPVALIVNACTSVGSHLAEQLLQKDIQIIAIDDLSFSDKENLKEAIHSKDFHLLNFAIDREQIIEKIKALDIPRLDYGFFITDPTVPDAILGKGIINFVEIASQFNQSEEKKEYQRSGHPKLVFVSSINLYGKVVDGQTRILKEAETKFAKGIKHFKLNGRVVRLSDVFGPRMELDGTNPLARLIASTINDDLQNEKISLDFSERSLYVDDAVRLLIKSVLSGATSNKIYDGALLNPIRLSEIKNILADPMWSEENPPQITKLPEWPTPNLIKTMKELSWSPKTPIVKALRETVAYFKERPELVPETKPQKTNFQNLTSWSFSGSGFLDKAGDLETAPEAVEEEGKNQKDKKRDLDKEIREEAKQGRGYKFKRNFWIAFIAGILIYGLLWPLIYLGYQGISIKNNLVASKTYLEEGEFDKSKEEIKKAQSGLDSYQHILDNTKIVQKIPLLNTPYEKAGEIVAIAKEGVDGAYYATLGSQSLFQTTKIISGESREDPTKYYQDASRDLDFASTKLAKVYAKLGDPQLKEGLPQILSGRIDDLKVRVGYYEALVEQAKMAANLMPKITGLDGKRSYLVLLQNNLELRPTGGFIGSYAKLDFEDGRLTNIKVDDIYNLDGQLKEVIAPPPELKQDLNLERLYLRDSNYDPDFPSSARQAEFFYKKEAGEPVHGVIALDLQASGNLLDAVGGLDLPEYGEAVNGSNLFEKAISHAEANFFPGSQAKKNYLTSLQNQLFNKIFYLSKQNWPAIIQAISKSLKEKHMLVYLEDPSLFSYLASSNWSGVFPRQGEAREGETNDFLAVVESNMGANKANYFLQRKYEVDASFTKEGLVENRLRISYKNTSPSQVFPAGIYKNRIKIYTPLGSKLRKATWGEADITGQFTSFSDYGRSGFTTLLELAPKAQQTLSFEYELGSPLSFKDNASLYRMEIFKQPGIMADPLDFRLTYPINFKLEQKPEDGKSGVQEVKIQTDMQTDRIFQFKIKK